jgi:hypothetical protein
MGRVIKIASVTIVVPGLVMGACEAYAVLSRIDPVVKAARQQAQAPETYQESGAVLLRLDTTTGNCLLYLQPEPRYSQSPYWRVGRPRPGTHLCEVKSPSTYRIASSGALYLGYTQYLTVAKHKRGKNGRCTVYYAHVRRQPGENKRTGVSCHDYPVGSRHPETFWSK